jgi:ribosomal protein S1
MPPRHNDAQTTTPASKAEPLSAWDILQEQMHKGKSVRGQIIRVVKSSKVADTIIGVNVRINGLEGFAPFRLLGLSRLECEQSVTLEKSFFLEEMTKGEKSAHHRIILNHRLALKEERKACLTKNLKTGMVVSGRVRSIASFGAFIDIEGGSALIHIKDLPGGKLDSVRVGENVEALVVKVDRQKNEVGASIRQLFLSRLKS